MKIKAYQSFRQAYHNLPMMIRKKVDKQLSLLSEDFRHPSLHTKKIKGREGISEARIDLYYRTTFEVIEDTIMLRVVGSRDETLKSP